MPRANHDGVSIAYERASPEYGETVVFVEGLGYGRWMWRFQRRGLDAYETVLWDNRGTGESDVPEGPYTMDGMAGDLEAVFDDAGIESAHVVGASMGGMIAMQYAFDYDRARSLALLCTSPGGPEAVTIPEETAERIFEVPEELDEREAIRYKMAPATSDEFRENNESLVEQIVDWRLESDASAQARAWQAAAVQGFDVSDRLDELDLPTLVLHGTADRVVPVENGELLADRLPNAEFVTFEDGPHLFFVETPEQVNQHLRRFLADV